jgi:uncharacterized iron-regulated protein
MPPLGYPKSVPRRTALARGTAWLAAGVLAPGTLLGLNGCASTPDAGPRALPLRLNDLGPMDGLLLGEQHDAPEHQRIHRAVLQVLLQWEALAAVVLEMADIGHSTRGLNAQSSPQQVQVALDWRDSAWPWSAYGPAVMEAVRAGVPVWGGNRPNHDNAALMKDRQWEQRVSPGTLAAQREAVREGHCNLLPESQIAPMTRIQLARDASLAATLVNAAERGKTVVLLCGSQHAHRQLGVPQYLPAAMRVKSVRLAADGARIDDAAAFDAVWPTAPVAPRDYCAELRGAAPRR